MSDSSVISAQARQWALDAQAAVDTWVSSGTWTTTKDATLKETIRRLGILMSNVADHLDHYNWNG